MAYSKTQVDRAGRLVAAQIRRIVEGAPQTAPAEDFIAAVEVINWWRTEHVKPLSRVGTNLSRYASDEGRPILAQRLKRVPTIAGKLVRESGRLTQMEDIGGVRAVFESQESAYRVANRLRRNWTITRYRDYVSSPKPGGYRALHLTNRYRGKLIEIQLRTTRQDKWANVAEIAIRRFPELKTGDGPPKLREFFESASTFYAMVDGSIELDMSFLREFEGILDQADTF